VKTFVNNVAIRYDAIDTISNYDAFSLQEQACAIAGMVKLYRELTYPHCAAKLPEGVEALKRIFNAEGDTLEKILQGLQKLGILVVTEKAVALHPLAVGKFSWQPLEVCIKDEVYKEAMCTYTMLRKYKKLCIQALGCVKNEINPERYTFIKSEKPLDKTQAPRV